MIEIDFKRSFYNLFFINLLCPLEGRVIFLLLLLNDLNSNIMSNEEKEFIERYFKLDKSLQYEVRERMQIIYSIQHRDFYIPVVINNFVSKTEKEVFLKMIKKNANKINLYLGYKDWDIISNSKLNELIYEYCNEHPELQRAEDNNLPF